MALSTHSCSWETSFACLGCGVIESGPRYYFRSSVEVKQKCALRKCSHGNQENSNLQILTDKFVKTRCNITTNTECRCKPGTFEDKDSPEICQSCSKYDTGALEPLQAQRNPRRPYLLCILLFPSDPVEFPHHRVSLNPWGLLSPAVISPCLTGSLSTSLSSVSQQALPLLSHLFFSLGQIICLLSTHMEHGNK